MLYEVITIQGAGGTGDADRPVGQRHPVARRARQGGIAERGKEQSEGKVDGACDAIGDDAEVQDERQGRGIPQLEQGPAKGDP